MAAVLSNRLLSGGGRSALHRWQNIWISQPGYSEENYRMGLNERRKIKELQDVTIPERTAELAEITGGSPVYDIDWESLADDLEGLNFMDNISCHRTNMALRAICMDALGKEAA